MPENLDELLELKLDSLLEKLTPEDVYQTLNQLAEKMWKKGKTIEVINDNSSISENVKHQLSCETSPTPPVDSQTL